VSNAKLAIKKVKNGIVSKITDEKTAKVKVDIRMRHPLYQKVLTRTESYLVHAEGKEVSVGDRVQIVECRPISKNKRWRIRNVVV
jgi:small subunit ribosomal protein S17